MNNYEDGYKVDETGTPTHEYVDGKWIKIKAKPETKKPRRGLPDDPNALHVIWRESQR